MPTYDYKCNGCGHRFEQFQSMKDKPLRKCPACGKSALERLIGTGAAVLFKGSGFYQTDYRSEGYKKAAEAESKPATNGKDGSSAGKSADPGSGGSDKKEKTKSPKPEKGDAKKSP